MESTPDLRSTSLTNLISPSRFSKPIGIRIFGSCFKFESATSKRNFHKVLVIILTFLAYAVYHMGRRPLSVVKNVLNKESSHSTPKDGTIITIDLADSHPGNWAPFDNDATANQLLALLDTAFLLSYAICMFFSGMVAERVNLRYFISAGIILSGIGLVAFGLAYHLNIHSLAYFVVIQMFSGAVQSTGWPVVVTCVSNWFEPSKRGLIYGIWNSHTSIGNILGATIAGFFVEKNWGLSFIVPGGIMITVGIILFLFLVPNPQDVELTSLKDPNQRELVSNQGPSVLDKIEKGETRKTDLGKLASSSEEIQAVSFMTALKIPGVIEYSACLFFSKLVSYTFLYWLPRYIKASTTFNSEDSAYLSAPFDVGGIAGAIFAGYLSDVLKMDGLICNVMLLSAIPAMFAYKEFGSMSSMHNILLQLIAGALVNGPYCLITTSVSADLGNRIKDGKAMATVSAIIDGMGSVGAVVGPLFAGLVSTGSWTPVFVMLMLSDVFASMCLTRVTLGEINKIFKRKPAEPEAL